MNRSVFKFPSSGQPMQFDGERYTSGIEGPIQREHYHRYLFALRYAADKDVLDVASGEGYGSYLLGQIARSIIGVDIDRKAVDFANKNYMSRGISYRQGDAARLPIDDQSIDLVVSFETIEHFADQIAFIEEINRVLRPEGLLIISSPNREIYSEAQNYQNPFHVKELNKQEFVDLLARRFSQIQLLEQGAVHGSVIRPLSGMQLANTEGFTTRDGLSFERLMGGVPDAPYFIALAARAPFVEAPQSILHSDFYHLQTEERFAELENLRQTEAGTHTRHVQELAAVEATLRAELAAERNKVAILEHQRETEAGTHAQYAQERAAIEAELRAELAVEQSKVAITEGMCERERENNEKFSERAHQLEAEIGALQDQLKSWKQCAERHEIQISDAQALIAAQRDELVRRLALTRTRRDSDLPPTLKGLHHLISKKKRRFVREYRLLATSPLFDSHWYRERNPDIAAVDPIVHYLKHGAVEGRQPGPLFDVQQYLLANPDVAAAKVNPLLHLLKHGAAEGRALRAPEAAAPKLAIEERLSPATQYKVQSQGEVVAQSSLFDAQSYKSLPQKVVEPALHRVAIGKKLQTVPSESFDPEYYLARYPDIRAAGVHPHLHFLHHGKAEGRRGLPAAYAMNFPPLEDERRPILIVCHEASRTGAPILGWNLVRALRKKHPVITLLMRGGILTEDFITSSDVVIGPLTYEDWHPIELAAIAERLVKIYQPLYAVANSIETSPIVPTLAALGVPFVALVHEFASYTRPLERMRDTYDWATHIVFPAQIVADSSFESFRWFEKRRGIHILAQGRQFLPSRNGRASAKAESDIGKLVRSEDEKDKFVVLGAGSVHIRKGVDLFLSVAASAQRLAPDVRFKFVWVGDGYKPDEDVHYSVYLHEQIKKAALQETIVFLDPVIDFEPAYKVADVFLLSSRLDPQPNVCIDAITLGLPTVCFAGACGTAEVLASDRETQSLVVPHLDVEAAAREICRLARSSELRKAMGRAVERVGRTAYDGEIYADQIDAWGCEAAAALSKNDLEALRASGLIEPELALPPHANLPRAASVEQTVLVQSSVVGTSPNQHGNAYFRRAIPGFHPQSYADAHGEDCGPGGENPIAHWLRHGRPAGAWAHPVFSPEKSLAVPRDVLRVALHAHFYYPDLAPELAERLTANRTRCDLFISTDTESKADDLYRAFAEHNGSVNVRVMPNIGRDIGPLLTGLGEEIASGNYDLWGHVHGKKSVWSTTGLGDSFRTFLWDNLIGGEYPMLDVAVDAFGSNPKLGLAFPEDPHLVGWDDNRETAEYLAERMGLSRPLPEFFDFPIGTMFWFRPLALRRLFALGLKWQDYPKEPVPYDGSLLHALERIIPFVAQSEALEIAGLRSPHSNW